MGLVPTGTSTRRSSRARQASRSSPSAYRIRRPARLPGGPNRLRATTTSVCWPTTSRPSRIQARRSSSRRSPADSATAGASGPAPPGGSSRTSRTPARRARAARRWSRSATVPGRVPRGSRGGRSTTTRSTERPVSSAPVIASPSSRSCGVTTTSHGRRTPRATASTGSKLRPRSSHATIEPAACASAARRSARVVLPLDPSPRTATLVARGMPPGPRIASRAGNPVRTIPTAGAWSGTAVPASSGTGSGTVASAPTTSPNPSTVPPPPRAPEPPVGRGWGVRGAAAPQRASRVASAAETSGGRVATPEQ